MMRQYYANRRTPATWSVPGGLVGVATNPMTGQPALAPSCPISSGKLEYFLAGTEPAASCVVIPATAPVSADPVLGDTIDLDSLLLGQPVEEDGG